VTRRSGGLRAWCRDSPQDPLSDTRRRLFAIVLAGNLRIVTCARMVPLFVGANLRHDLIECFSSRSPFEPEHLETPRRGVGHPKSCLKSGSNATTLPVQKRTLGKRSVEGFEEQPVAHGEVNEMKLSAAQGCLAAEVTNEIGTIFAKRAAERAPAVHRVKTARLDGALQRVKPVAARVLIPWRPAPAGLSVALLVRFGLLLSGLEEFRRVRFSRITHRGSR
jgi:hypothetical protein